MQTGAVQPVARREADADAALDAQVLADLREFAGPDDAAMVERLVALFLDEARSSNLIAEAIARAGLVGVDVAPANSRKP